MMSGSGLRAQLFRGGVGSLALKAAATGLSFLVAVVLARALGPGEYGLYAYVFALVSLLSVPARFGLPSLVVRETARAQVSEDWGAMRGLWRWATGAVALITAVIGLLGAIAVWGLDSHLSDVQRTTLIFGLLLVPLIALGDLRGAALRGLQRVVVGQLPEAVLRRGLLVLFMLGLILLFPARTRTAADAMALHTLAAFVAFLVGGWMLWHWRPPALRSRPVSTYRPRAWAAAALPLAMLAGMQIVSSHTDVIMLGLFRSSEEVGIYRVAVQGGALVVFGLQAVNVVVAPHFARLHAARDPRRLEALVAVTARASLAVAAPLALALIVFGDIVLQAFFGTAFAVGHTALSIIAIGQLVNAGAGSVGYLLNMTGHERDTARCAAAAAVGNVALNAILIPPLGINGAALATSLTLVLMNVLLWRDARTRLGIQGSSLWRVRSVIERKSGAGAASGPDPARVSHLETQDHQRMIGIAANTS